LTQGSGSTAQKPIYGQFDDRLATGARTITFGILFSAEEDLMRTTFLKWMVVVGGACLATAVIHPRLARSADHLDAPATTAEPAADINDVYTFLDKPGDAATKVIFAMTVFPNAPATAKFSDTVQYVFHTSSGPKFGATTTDLTIICTFDAAQKAQCWAGADEYATGDASAATGIVSASGKFKVFAGLRADPFFFNLDGFKKTVQAVEDTVDGGALNFDDAGCPLLQVGTDTALQNFLKTNPDGGGAAQDFFKKFNGLAIVVEMDKSVVAKGGGVISVWASSHRKP
jgi:hypothetical protein